ncbi:MAG: hypothetical protein HW378_3485, partial [Anaerolineales bacterium]|nr:hypothetical protein [Anaerolineales bacterium]
MLDVEARELTGLEATRLGRESASQRWLPLALTVGMLVIAARLAGAYLTRPVDDPALVESTPGQLVLWIAGRRQLNPEALLGNARLALAIMCLLTAGATTLGLAALWRRPVHSRRALFWALAGFDILLLNVPVAARGWYWLVLAALALALLTLFVAPGPVSRALGTFIVISALLLGWEVYIALGQATGGALPLTDFPWKMPHWQAIAEQL